MDEIKKMIEELEMEIENIKTDIEYRVKSLQIDIDFFLKEDMAILPYSIPRNIAYLYMEYGRLERMRIQYSIFLQVLERYKEG